MLNLKTLVMALLLLCSFSAKSEQAEVLRLVTDSWTSYTNKDGTGYYFEVLDAIYRPHNIEINTRFVPYSRSELMLQNGEADIVLGVYKGVFDESWYSELPLHLDIVDAAMSQELSDKWRGLQSLRDKRIVAYIGYDYDHYIDLGEGYFEVGSIESMIKMLVAGRVDVVLDYKIDLIPKQKSLGLEGRFVVKDAVLVFENFFAFHNPQKNHRFKAIFDLGLRRLITTGELKNILIKNLKADRYYPDYSKYDVINQGGN